MAIKRWNRWGIVVLVIASARLAAWAQEDSRSVETALVEAENQVTASSKGSDSWQKAVPVLPLGVGDKVQTGELSRAVVRLSDSAMLRLDELTTIEIVRPARESEKPVLDISSGAMYFFSREKPRELEIRTPAATGALRGTEFVVRVESGGRTRISMLDGEVELANAAGSVLLRSGEQGEVEVGRAPRKTAMLEATNIIQWVLYYPAVLDPRELGMSDGERRAVAASLAAYGAGDLLGALEKYPRNHRPSSAAGRLYYAAVLLAVGRVDKAEHEMAGVSEGVPARGALEQMIAAVKFEQWTRSGEPQTAGEWIAQSYYAQSKSNLEKARTAAKRATELAPDFGYAWVRLAELQFSFGHTPEALAALEQGLQLTPRNAQGYSLRGFLLSAQNRIARARASFDEAIVLDGALGNAWLGRGLTFIRQGQSELGRRDLQTAAVLEPNRSLFRSYLGKAFSEVGDNRNAHRDFDRAKELDPRDPTPWLYSAVQNKQENRYNAAIDDLEKSIALNDNRSVFRSRFLLEQDRSIRGTNLAAIFLNDGMREQSVREAVRAVDADYGSAPAHLFLANSYNALRDPTRILLRYETAWFNELLLSNLLSPVGGGPLSQFVSEQEYSKMFEHDGLGFSSIVDYFSYGELRITASQYGTFGNISYALDTEYQYNDGLRPNNRISRSESYGQVKIQLGPQDTVFFQTKYENLENGDVFQRYDQRDIDKTLDFHERQDPALLLLGWHHEWSPGNHTLLLIGRLANQQTLTSQDTTQSIITRDVSPFTAGLPAENEDLDNPFGNPTIVQTLRGLVGRGRIQAIDTFPLDLAYEAEFETITSELQHIATLGPHTLVLGARYQNGQFDTRDRLTSRDPHIPMVFDRPPANQGFEVSLERINIYLYDTWHVTSWVSLIGGVTYDRLQYPENFRSPPINGRQRRVEHASPKAGVLLQPFRGTVVRASFAEAISGASFDESIRLEPTQIAGFAQAYRSLASESLIGSVAGSMYRFWGVSLEQKLPARTYLGVEFQVLKQDLVRNIGVFDFLNSGISYPNAVLPSALEAKDEYGEDILAASVNQLVGDNWSIGARYRYTRSQFRERFEELQESLGTADPTLRATLSRAAELRRESKLHESSIFALYNHPSGFFARAEGKWFKQDNETLRATGSAGGETVDSGPPGDDFWQFDIVAGWRFARNQCEVSCGVLNLNGSNYQLDPLNPYIELPRDRTLVVRAKLSF